MTDPKPSKTGIPHAFGALGYSIAGLKAAATGEVAFRQELVLWVVLTPIAFWLPATLTQTAILIASMTMVLVVELVNSAIEATVDRISFERHDLAKRAKDTGSAAVLVALVNSVLCWVLIVVDVYQPAAN